MAATLPKSEAFHDRLTERLMGFLSVAMRGEEARRRTDRIGGNLYYGRHWQVAMPQNRSSLTVNVTKALIDHKISIMTKQQPLPVVECTDYGDEEAAKLMRSLLQQWWTKDRMQEKLEQALLLANVTRTCALKALWDPTLHGGIGNITCDVIPGYRLILDPRTRFKERMQFCGDVAHMTRTRAMMIYPQAATVIRDGPAVDSSDGRGGDFTSPIRGAWQRIAVDFPGVALLNGKPVVTAFTSQPSGGGLPEEEVVIAEIYYRDYSTEKVVRPAKDHRGQVKQRIRTDENGMPQFNERDPEHHALEDGTTISLPMFELQMEDVLEEVQVLKYPHWRRSTMMLPDRTLLEDIAWDYPLPYSFVHDGGTLEGSCTKGSALDLEDLQAQLNVSLSLMVDNLRFSACRAAKAGAGAQIEKNNLNLAPGEILRLGDINQLEFLEFPQLSGEWFNWLNSSISLMERLIGATGIMQGEAAGRVDSAAGYDLLAEIGGSRIVKATQRMERAVEELMEIVGCFAQKHYDERHAVAVENLEGELSFERITPASLQGSFNYKILTGSSMAWSQTAVRSRIMEDLQAGLRDKVSAWKNPAMGIDDWRQIEARMAVQPPQLNPAPPPRTRQQIKPPGKKKGPTR